MIDQQSRNDLALLDEEFLVNLLSAPERRLFARVATLDINELPIEQIEGRVSGGSINVDGTSSVRRTCSLTMISNNVNITDFYWGLRSKFKLEIGVQNKLTNPLYSPDSTIYPEVVWFPCGVFILNSFNVSKNTNSCNISLSGKDKMCMLNGEIGGSINAQTDFGQEEVIQRKMIPVDFDTEGYPENSSILMSRNYYIKDDSGDIVIEDISYKQIFSPEGLFSLSNEYVQHQRYAINNSNYDTYYTLSHTETAPNTYYSLKELYTIDETCTINHINLRKIITEALHTYAQEPYHNIVINDLSNYGLEQLTYKGDKEAYIFYKIDENNKIDINQCNLAFADNLTTNVKDQINDQQPFKFVNFSDLTPSTPAADYTKVNIAGQDYIVAKIAFGEDLGYRLTELTYPGELILSAGESLTSLLDKIKNMLGDFEYFYDVDGRFIFQRKRTYVNTSWSQIVNNGDEFYTTYANALNKISFNFEGNRLITAITNAPVLNNVRNDFTVWGKKKLVSGAEIPIHARYAIDRKPTFYKNLNGQVFIADSYSQIDGDDTTSPVKVDWRELIYQMALDYFKLGLKDEENFLYNVGLNNKNYYPSGKTGYEQYYTDLQEFWRLLYKPNYQPAIKHSGEYQEEIKQETGSVYYTKGKKWVDTSTLEDPEYYYLKTDDNDKSLFAVEDEEDPRLWWNVNIFNDPGALLFWFDFLDQGEELAQFSVSQIGDRPKVTNNDKASAICFKNIPTIILRDSSIKDNLNYQEIKQEFSGYQFIQMRKGLMNYFSISAQGTSVKTEIDNLLYQHGYCAENITITALPIYYLQPNTRVYVCDKDTQTNGEYIVTRYTIPLTYNGTMSITANKAPDRLV